MSRLRPALICTAAIAAALVLAAPAKGAAGDLDPSFASSGKFLLPFANDAQVTDTVVQSDGKVVLAGYVHQDGQTADADFVVRRLNADGSVDSGFGGGGSTTIPINLVANGNDFAMAVALGPGGEIVVAGYAQAAPGSGDDVAVVRLTPGGLPDGTFGGGDGIVTRGFGSFDRALGVAVQPGDGKVLTAGTKGVTGSGFSVLRFEEDGDPDPTFDADGEAEAASFGSGTTGDSARALAVLGDGKIVAAGEADTSSGAPADIALARYTAAGALDSGFGSGGKTQTPGPGQEHADDLALAPDGKLVVAGGQNNLAGALRFLVARYTAGGTPDPAWNGGNTVFTPVTFFCFATGVAIQQDGLVLVGGSGFVSQTDSDFALARYTDSGALDSSFGTGGTRTQGIGAANDFANMLALQPLAGGGERALMFGVSQGSNIWSGGAFLLQGGPANGAPPPPPPPTPTPVTPPVIDDDFKKRLKKTSKILKAGAGGLAVVGGVAQVAIGPGTLAGGIALIGGGVLGLGSLVIDVLAEDPPDPNFREIARPRTRTAPGLKPGRRLPRRTANAINTWSANAARIASVGDALLHAIERAQGAAQAGDADWTRRQTSAAVEYADREARLFAADVSLRSRVARLLKGRFNLTARPAQIKSFKAKVARSGLPPALTTVLRRFGFDRADTAGLRAEVLRVPARTLRFPRILTDRRVAAEERAIARRLRQFAARFRP